VGGQRDLDLAILRMPPRRAPYPISTPSSLDVIEYDVEEEQRRLSGQREAETACTACGAWRRILVDDAFYRSLVMSAGAFDYYFTSSASSPSAQPLDENRSRMRARQQIIHLSDKNPFSKQVEAALLAAQGRLLRDEEDGRPDPLPPGLVYDREGSRASNRYCAGFSGVELKAFRALQGRVARTLSRRCSW
jgi:hypothetical protein